MYLKHLCLNITPKVNGSLKREKLIQKIFSGPFCVLAQYHSQQFFWTSLTQKFGSGATQGSRIGLFGWKKLIFIGKMWFLQYWPKRSVPQRAPPIFLDFPIGNTPYYNIWKIQGYKMEYRAVIAFERVVQIFQTQLQAYTPFCITEFFI